LKDCRPSRRRREGLTHLPHKKTPHGHGGLGRFFVSAKGPAVYTADHITTTTSTLLVAAPEAPAPSVAVKVTVRCPVVEPDVAKVI